MLYTWTVYVLPLPRPPGITACYMCGYRSQRLKTMVTEKGAITCSVMTTRVNGVDGTGVTMAGWTRSSVVVVVVVALLQICTASGNKVCTYHTYTYGHSRALTYKCHDWEYCCSGVCCHYPVLIHRLWYFWVGILALAFFLLLASVTWYKKRYYGRVLRVHPAPIGPGAVHMHTVTTQQFIQTPTYPGSYVAVPPGAYVAAPPGPPPPYSSLPAQTQGKHPPPAGPMQPAYLPPGMTHPSQWQQDNDSNRLF